ncbi:MAG: hypothetical protein JSS27_05255 [Planctomycetes bacterium]|nr:hypothetical protein [Planctomycetota bacterium]
MEKPPVHDYGQNLAPYGRVIGIVDSQAGLDATIEALKQAGVSAGSVSYLSGVDGVHLLERAEGFFFSDAEDDALKEHLKELKAGGFVLRVKAKDQAEATQIVRLAARHGGRHFAFFGVWVVTQLT